MKYQRSNNSFSKSEFRSLIATVTIIVLGVLIPPYASRLAPDPTPPAIKFNVLPLPDTAKAQPHAGKNNNSTAGTGRKKVMKTRRQLPKIDINTADSLTWKTLPGIGNVLSKRIVKFRDKLGGFHSIEQVSLTYGLDRDVFDRIRPRLALQTPHKKYAIESCSVRDLAGHPFISWKQAEKLHSINANGDTLDMDILYTLGDSAWVQQISPYFPLYVESLN